jgi:hypothetical protein
MTGIVLASATAFAQQPSPKPNILVIWGDDIGQSNLSVYTKGLIRIARPTSIASPTRA